VTLPLRFCLIGILALLLTVAGHAASAKTDQQQINDHVWRPFARAIVERDLDLYFSVHSPEIIRAELGASKVSRLDAYRADMLKYWTRSRPAGAPQDTFELRFTKRASNATAAYETGYYKSEFTRPNGERGVYYGAFHVTLRKENDRWKILVDADGFDGPRPTEETFQAAQPLEPER